MKRAKCRTWYVVYFHLCLKGIEIYKNVLHYAQYLWNDVSCFSLEKCVVESKEREPIEYALCTL